MPSRGRLGHNEIDAFFRRSGKGNRKVHVARPPSGVERSPTRPKTAQPRGGCDTYSKVPRTLRLQFR